jgi:predicted aldo/keto reductase-like oxidoreductase
MEKAAACSKCHECEERCPYHLPIRDMIAEFYEQYEKDKINYQGTTGAR